MICLLAGNYQEAKTWAYGQQLNDDEWFYPHEISDLLKRTNFHTLVIGTAGYNTSEQYFNRIYTTAKQRGRMK